VIHKFNLPPFSHPPLVKLWRRIAGAKVDNTLEGKTGSNGRSIYSMRR